MNRALAFVAIGLGLVLLLLSVTRGKALVPLWNKEQEPLILRQIGHEYLRCMGDSTSTLPAVTTHQKGGYLLRLEQSVDYDQLVATAAVVMDRLPTKVGYSLSLADCQSEEVFLGSFSPAVAPAGGTNAPSCTGRDQPERCANILLGFVPPAPEKNNQFPWWMFGLGLMAYGCFLAVRDPYLGTLSSREALLVGKKPTVVPANSFAPNASFNPTAQLLTIDGEKQELTYRETQLLRYLIQRPNEVLSRQDIHDAVWGAEGIMVGRSLDVFVSRLRKKLQDAEGIKIQTVHGVGYRLRVGAGD